MEKFTVDLDQVLDEFEYNEDCAEKVSQCPRKFDHMTSDVANKHIQGQGIVDSSKLSSHQDAAKSSFSVNAMPVNSTILNSKLDDGVVPSEMEWKELINDCNSRQSPPKLHNITTSNKLGEHKSLLPSKLNVSGVFSSLNEYINSGGIAFKLSEPDDDASINENEVLKYEIKRTYAGWDLKNADLKDMKNIASAIKRDSQSDDSLIADASKNSSANLTDSVEEPGKFGSAMKYHLIERGEKEVEEDKEEGANKGPGSGRLIKNYSSEFNPDVQTCTAMDTNINLDKYTALNACTDRNTSSVKNSDGGNNNLPCAAPIVFDATGEYDEELLTLYLNELEEHDIHSAVDQSLVDESPRNCYKDISSNAEKSNSSSTAVNSSSEALTSQANFSNNAFTSFVPGSSSDLGSHSEHLNYFIETCSEKVDDRNSFPVSLDTSASFEISRNKFLDSGSTVTLGSLSNSVMSNSDSISSVVGATTSLVNLTTFPESLVATIDDKTSCSSRNARIAGDTSCHTAVNSSILVTTGANSCSGKSPHRDSSNPDFSASSSTPTTLQSATSINSTFILSERSCPVEISYETNAAEDSHSKFILSPTSNIVSVPSSLSSSHPSSTLEKAHSQNIVPVNSLEVEHSQLPVIEKTTTSDSGICSSTRLSGVTASSITSTQGDFKNPSVTTSEKSEGDIPCIQDQLISLKPSSTVNTMITIECQQTNGDVEERSNGECWNEKVCGASESIDDKREENDVNSYSSIVREDSNSSLVTSETFGNEAAEARGKNISNQANEAEPSVLMNANGNARDTPVSSPDTSETSSVEVSCPYSSQESGISNSGVECLPELYNKLGKVPPFWVPDEQAPTCMLCGVKFTVIKRRHHCRACGKVFCSKCCCQKYRLEYLNNTEVRVCQICFDTLVEDAEQEHVSRANGFSNDSNDRQLTISRQPNPNNPMEYCSTIPPLEQAASAVPQPVPSVLVPVGVLKREGSTRLKSEVAKQVMFSDGIRPGGDLTEVETSPEECAHQQSELVSNQMKNFSGLVNNNSVYTLSRPSRSFEKKTKSFLSCDGLPPLAMIHKGKLKLEDVPPGDMFTSMESLRSETNNPAMFALNQNLFVKVKILNLDCCVNRTCWCFSTVGMSCVGQDEIVIILECLPEDTCAPKDIFHFLNDLYRDASRGTLVSEMGHTTFKTSTFLGSAEHGGFLFIRPSFQCIQKIIQPPAPYLVGILIHRWEIPWAKVFPIRLMLRLGAEFRYYPCMLVSVRMREAVYCEIGHTIINLLADFHTLRYTLPSIRGMVIHMEDRHTSILLPKNRYDQVARALNNSNDHVLALAANFSLEADSHLVCIQSPTDDSYHTQAINIHNKPRKVTGASFVVFNGALKISSNLMAKSTIVEDGLMVQITQDMIQELRSCLHKMKDFVVHCGPATASEPDETVDLRWVDDDRNFNVGVKSIIDGMTFDGVPSIRVHNGSDYAGKTRFIRWTEVFILQPGNIVDGLMGTNDPVDISRIAESLATATCTALCDFLDLLAQGGFSRIAVRANIHQDNVGYIVGGQGERLPPIYMKTLDSTLVPVLHHTANIISNSSPLVLELLFHIMFQ